LCIGKVRDVIEKEENRMAVEAIKEFFAN